MKKLLMVLSFVMLAMAWQNSYAQDLIYKKNKEVIVAKILEIGTDEVKYKEYNSKEEIIFSIAKSELWKVKFENGKEMLFFDDFSNTNMYADNRKNAIKVDFFAPLYYKMFFSYERSLKPGMSYEAGLGIIGVGHNPYNQNDNYSYAGVPTANYSASGAFARFGFKFIRTPDYYIKGMRYAHILKGSYVKPEITLGNYSETTEISYVNSAGTPVVDKSKTNVTFGALMINLGKQWVFNDMFLIDYYVGLGYCFDDKPKPKTTPYYTYDNSFNNYALYKFSNSSPFAINAGFKIGILLK